MPVLNLGSILEPEVVLLVFMHMRSEKITKTTLKMQLVAKFPYIWVLRHGGFESEVHFETGSSWCFCACTVKGLKYTIKTQFYAKFPCKIT